MNFHEFCILLPKWLISALTIINLKGKILDQINRAAKQKSVFLAKISNSTGLSRIKYSESNSNSDLDQINFDLPRDESRDESCDHLFRSVKSGFDVELRLGYI